MTDRKVHLDSLAIGLVILCCAIWGLGQVASKAGLAEIPPLLQAGGRSLLAAILITLWAALRRISLWRADGTLGAGLLVGALFGIEFGCIFLGLQYTTASRMTVFLYLAPFVVALGMHFISPGERLVVAMLEVGFLDRIERQTAKADLQVRGHPRMVGGARTVPPTCL